MIQRLRTLFFSTTLLSMSTLSAQAMEDSEKNLVHQHCKQYNLTDQFAKDIYQQVKGKPNQLNKFGVTHLQYETAFFLFHEMRDPSTFKVLFDLFEKMPQNKRKGAFEELNSFAKYKRGLETQRFLCEFKYLLGSDKVVWSPYKIEGAISLEEKLLQLPYKRGAI